MAKPKNIPLTEDGVITQEALLAYAQGRLSDAERVQIDNLLRDDPFAQDALEGMKSSPAPAEISTVVISLNTQLREKTGVRERKKKGIDIHWANYAYAAVVLGVLVSVGYVMIHVLSNNAREEAMNKPVAQAQESKPILEEKKKEEPKIDSTNLVSTESDSASRKAGYVNAETPPSAIDEARPSADKEIKKTEASILPIADKSSPVTATPVGSQTGAQLNTAKTIFESGDYVGAEKKYNEILASQPNNADALYFGGICAYLNGSRGSGEANFDKLASSSLYSDGTKWYKANILIKKGKKEDAKQLLRDLVNTNSIFKDRAVKLYEDLYKK